MIPFIQTNINYRYDQSEQFLLSLLDKVTAQNSQNHEIKLKTSENIKANTFANNNPDDIKLALRVLIEQEKRNEELLKKQAVSNIENVFSNNKNEHNDLETKQSYGSDNLVEETNSATLRAEVTQSLLIFDLYNLF